MSFLFKVSPVFSKSGPEFSPRVCRVFHAIGLVPQRCIHLDSHQRVKTIHATSTWSGFPSQRRGLPVVPGFVGAIVSLERSIPRIRPAARRFGGAQGGWPARTGEQSHTANPNEGSPDCKGLQKKKRRPVP